MYVINCPLTEHLRDELHIQCDDIAELFNAHNGDRILIAAEYCERTLNIDRTLT